MVGMEMRRGLEGSGIASSGTEGEVGVLRDGSERGVGLVISTSSGSMVAKKEGETLC